MSQNHGGRLARQPTSDKPGRPSLDRPSLFAGMDNEDSTFGGDTQRVRILSTLESARRPAGRKKLTKIHGITKKKRRHWQTKVLLGLLGIGVLTLLTSFVMVVRDGHNAPARTESEPGNKPTSSTPAAKRLNGALTPGASDANNPLAALIAPPAHPAQPQLAHQAAVIENVISTPPPAPPAAAHEPVKQAAPSMAPQMSPHKPPMTAQVTAAVTTNKPTASATMPPQAMPTSVAPAATRRAQNSKGQDEDVALLEAMFAHTRPRPVAAAVSVADELKQRCGSLSGADAATCRARICVQNPTATACHQD